MSSNYQIQPSLSLKKLIKNDPKILTSDDNWTTITNTKHYGTPRIPKIQKINKVSKDNGKIVPKNLILSVEPRTNAWTNKSTSKNPISTEQFSGVNNTNNVNSIYNSHVDNNNNNIDNTRNTRNNTRTINSNTETILDYHTKKIELHKKQLEDILKLNRINTIEKINIRSLYDPVLLSEEKTVNNINNKNNKKVVNIPPRVSKSLTTRCYICRPRQYTNKFLISESTDKNIQFYHDMNGRPAILVNTKTHVKNLGELCKADIADIFYNINIFCDYWNIKDYKLSYNNGNWSDSNHFHIKLTIKEIQANSMRKFHFDNQKLILDS